MTAPRRIFVGTAGWAIPRPVAERFAGDGSTLERYARVFTCAEINSSFKHEHRPQTYARWAASVPAGFRFSVKLPHEITHARRLAQVVAPLERFLTGVRELGDRLGPLLIQLPGSLALDRRVAGTFFGVLRRRFEGALVCEPRHPSWFEPAADALLVTHRVARVAADPARVAPAAAPGGWLGDAQARGIAYFRWHGSPEIYKSSYPAPWLAASADTVRAAGRHADAWCIFDNTAIGAATPDALAFASLLTRT